MADGDWWAFVKDNTDPNKIYVVREDPNSATGWVIDDNEHFDLPVGPQGDPGTPGADGSDGAQGDPGLPGADGTDALWNYVGEYSGGSSYAVGDVVTYDGQLWYRYNSNGGNVGDTPSPGLWNLLAAKGADGAQGTAGADFGIYYLGNYISTNGYITDIAVVRGSDGQLYLAKASGQLGDPIDYQSNGQWEVWIPKGADGSDGSDGISFLWSAEFDSGTTYPLNYVVSYQGSSYIKVAEGGTFSLPTDTNYWNLVAQKGDTGAQGEPGLDANLDTGTTTINSYNPVWSGTGLAYTNTPATGSYIKIGNLVTVQIDVLFTTVTNFGTGQYSLTLPFASKYHTDVYGGSIHKVTNQGTDHYSLKGHLAPTSSTFTVWAIGSSAADQTFNNNTPVGIDTDDKFHMSFSYICE